MKLLKLLSLTIIVISFLTACNDDEPIAPSGGSNTNSNATLNYINGVTESSNTNLQLVAQRIEIPRLKSGPNDLFVVHTVNTYGVNYCMEWNGTLRAQYWTAFRWDKQNTVSNTSRTNLWDVDPLIPSAYRSTLEDHYSNGYDRGHMIGSADRLCSKEANAQTFYMSNMHPQLSGFNGQGVWYELENRLRNLYNRNSFRDTLYVVKGGTINNGNYTTTKNNLPVPKYFFMAVLRKRNDISYNGGYSGVGFWMEHKTNTDTNIKNYAVSIDELENRTGIDFFCNLPDNIENEVEKSYSSTVWSLK